MMNLIHIISRKMKMKEVQNWLRKKCISKKLKKAADCLSQDEIAMNGIKFKKAINWRSNI
jgi:hypothetical protein